MIGQHDAAMRQRYGKWTPAEAICTRLQQETNLTEQINTKMLKDILDEVVNVDDLHDAAQGRIFRADARNLCLMFKKWLIQ